MPYIPQKTPELVWAKNPHQEESDSLILLVIGPATLEEKQRTVEALRAKLRATEELDEEELQAWFRNPHIYTCIDKNGVQLYDYAWFLGAARITE